MPDFEKEFYKTFIFANEGRASDADAMKEGTLETVLMRLSAAIARQKAIEQAYKSGS